MTFREKAALLRKYGFQTTYGQRGATGSVSHKKAAISRTFARVGRYLDNPRFIHVPSTRRTRDRFATKATKTPAGWFEQIPQGIDRKRVRITVSDGKVTKKYYDPRKGIDRIDTLIPLRSDRMATDPADYVKGVLAKNKSAKYSVIVVRGYEGLNYMTRDIAGDYIAEFAREIVEVKRKMSYDEFEDTFQLKLITAKDNRRKFGPKTKKKRKNKK